MMIKNKCFLMIMVWGFGIFYLGYLDDEHKYSIEWWIVLICATAAGLVWARWLDKLLFVPKEAP